MASPVLESRVEPHKKAHFNLHISDRIANSDGALASYSGVKYNHKPAQTSHTRLTTLTPRSSTNLHHLRLEDANEAGDKDIFTFTGHKSALKKSYVLVLDPASQQATLEPLSSTYTFNLATKNGKDVSTQHTKIYPKKVKESSQDKDEDEHLFGEAAAEEEGGDADPDNPYDFRHFLAKEKEKRGDESEYRYASSPDYRAGTGSAITTPQFGARTSSATSGPKPAVPVTKKRKTAAANPMVSKPKKPQPTPAVRLQRTPTDTPKPKTRAAAPPASRIKSSEIVHSSDESDSEAVSPPARPSPPPEQRQQHHDDDDADEDAEGDSDDGGLEIEVPDARPPQRNKGTLGPNLGTAYLRSPSNGPISLASAANSDVEGSPNPPRPNTQDEIDFGDLGGEDAEGEDDDEDYNQDIEPMDIGPPAQQATAGHDRKSSMAGDAAEDDEDDLEELMRRGLEGGDSSEERFCSYFYVHLTLSLPYRTISIPAPAVGRAEVTTRRGFHKLGKFSRDIHRQQLYYKPLQPGLGLESRHPPFWPEMAVIVEEYNPAWPQQFENIKSELEGYLQDVEYLSIEHVGSTSVPGLAAKPIIDVDIIVTRDEVQPAIDALIANGKFDYLGELGINDRHAFKDPNQSMRHNIYVCVDGAAQTRNHLRLRDTLRSNEELRDEYGRVKLQLAAKATNIVDYLVGKSAIIQKMLKLSGSFTKDELAAIARANVKGERFGAIQTPRLLLREFVIKDEQGYFALESHEQNARYQAWPPRTRQQARQLVLENIRTHNEVPRTIYELAVEHAGRFIGRVGAKTSQANSDSLPGESTLKHVTHADLWFSFLACEQGRGFATEAVDAFIEALKDRLQDQGKLELEIECDPRNHRCWKLAERLGFERLSLTKEAWECKGEWVDSLVLRKVVGDV
ncbi:UPF0157-domain-containing protein [Decorospora gaudefroyi]|uniref:UPF0157-domain-containing protein n=1 Tax=Decorospora gaudefroyi TaxID=184978 RepID=A0A6A5KHF6_9PLEO|nr:UPF0157-domain-containing protein [Decorospora gaudefroyi]